MHKLVIVLLLALLAGCQNTTGPGSAGGSSRSGAQVPYAVLAERIAAGETVSVAALREAFVNDASFASKLSRLTELENQALQLAADEPLKLGSLGSAILDLYHGSLAGHFAMQRFYEHVENVETAASHGAWMQRIQADIEASGDGTVAAPYIAVSPVEPVAFARSKKLLPVGSIYRSTQANEFILLLQARPEDGPLSSTHFDLRSVYRAIRSELTSAKTGSEADASARAEASKEFNPFALMVYLARQGDTAAQAAIGAYQASHERPDDAIEWLRSASRSGNVLANNLLARIFFEMAEKAEDDASREASMEEVMENYVHAIALGSLDSAYALGVLYVNEHYGPDNVASGLPLLRQASQGGHPGATLYLGHLSYQGRQVEQDYQQAADYYREAAASGSTNAQKTYARFLLDRKHNISGNAETIDWLAALAKDNDDPEAMLLLGNFSARGIGTSQNFRKARRWFEKAVSISAQDANIVNEVAWVLTVSHFDQLTRASYAQKIMSALMEQNDAARARPEYLDTWAATFAATGDFSRAVEIQQEALTRAKESNDPAVVEELEKHLQLFEAGQSITETAP
ncbi:MAG: hypothetical protein AB8B93_10675 [Pseudomonadales bacterium]